MILAIKTDSFDTELYLLDESGEVTDKKLWHAGRELSLQLLNEIEGLLRKNGTTIKDLKGVTFYQGPGSFTGLRIGAAVANTIGYSLQIPVAGLQGEEWLAEAGLSIKKANEFTPVVPLYGADAHITQPRK